ncbi:hypothetical protein SDC9_211367 [bioreactor metagenome]|uniref:Uncharacterized protein n=1 Tax=bioreactor metagenome TaxID=1076179 RepID=A0A645JWP2_9ZZZZ
MSGRLPCFGVGFRPCARTGFGAVARFHGFGDGQLVLPIEQGVLRLPDLRDGEVLVQRRKIGNQLEGIVPDLSQIVTVFIVAGIGTFDIGELLPQITFQPGVVHFYR